MTQDELRERFWWLGPSKRDSYIREPMSVRAGTSGVPTMPCPNLSFGQRRRVVLHVGRRDGGLDLLLHGDDPPASFHLDFSAKYPVCLRVRTTGVSAPDGYSELHHAWPMTRGPLRWAASRDPFQQATSWAYRQMYPPRGRDVSPRGRRRGPDMDARDTMRRLFSALADLERHAADMCDPAARGIALRFPFHLRWWIYARLVEDPTSRLAQLAAVCPGALTFAFGLEDAGYTSGEGRRAAAHALLADVIRGRRLDGALDDALERWGYHAEERDRSSEEWDPVWARVASTHGGERQALLLQQRLLIRRAGPMVATTNLFVPPPIVLAPEDIPRPVRDNARWFGAVKCSRRLLATPDDEWRERRLAFAAFVSRNAVALARVRAFETTRAVIDALHDYAIATNHWPGQRTSAAQFLEDSRLWHEQIHRVQALADVEGLAGGPGRGGVEPRSPLPPAPGGAWRAADAEVNPITTVQGLINEGWDMHHCVISRLQSVLTGNSAIFHASILGEPLTIEVRMARGRWKIAEVKGFANKEPDKDHWRELRKWEAHLPAVTVPDSTP